MRRGQYSVIAAMSAWSCLYSGELVMGRSDITFAMLPVTLTLPCQPCLAPATKMTKPSIFAMPSPRLLISEIVTSYSFPTSTGFGLKDLNPPLPPLERP